MLDDLDKELARRGHRFCRYADDCNIYVRSRRAGERVMTSVSCFLTDKLKLKVNETKSAVACPEARKFLGFSISNDGSERRIAPKVLGTFKARVRDMTRRTRGKSLPQVVEGLRPYLIGWRSYFGFCQTPRVLTNLEAWIRRRLRMYLWRQWQNGHNRFKELRRMAFPSSSLRSLPVHRPGSAVCQGIRRCKWHCATTSSTLSVCPASMSLVDAQPDRTAVVRTRMHGGVGGAAPEASPYPDQWHSFAVGRPWYCRTPPKADLPLAIRRPSRV